MSNAFQPTTVKYQAAKFIPEVSLTEKPIKVFESKDFQLMFDILCYKRQHDTKSEKQFCEDFLSFCHTVVDASGDVMAYIHKVDDSPVLWSCHTDAVHSGSGYQDFTYDSDFLWFSAKNQPLGADDGAGIWMLLSLIDAGIGGTYIFHRGEEVGGIGSSWMAKNEADWLRSFECAIAFDRRGSTSVITHQGGTRCCSDNFGNQLASLLPGMKLDTGGSFTDTKNYTGLIGECTNVSIGYMSEHSQAETLDFSHTVELRDAIVERFKDGFDFTYHRKPGEYESLYSNSYYGGGYYNKGLWDSYPYAKLQEEDDKYLEDTERKIRKIDLVSGEEEFYELLEMSDRQIKTWAENKTHNELVHAIQDLVYSVHQLLD